MEKINIVVNIGRDTAPAAAALNGPALVELIRKCARNNDIDAALLPIMGFLGFEDMGGSAELFFMGPLENNGGGIRAGWASLQYEYRADLLAEYIAAEIAEWVRFPRLAD
jgi:hypothetical protein